MQVGKGATILVSTLELSLRNSVRVLSLADTLMSFKTGTMAKYDNV